MIKITKNIFLSLFLISVLNSCAELNTQFDCPKKPGINCEMLDEVNDRINRGEFADEMSCTINCKECASSTPCRQCFECTIPANCNQQNLPCYLTKNIYRKAPRYSETVQRVWMAPFEDTAGNYHLESNVFTVVKPGHWVGCPVKAIDENEE